VAALAHKQIVENDEFQTSKASDEFSHLDQIINAQPKDFNYFLEHHSLEFTMGFLLLFAIGFLVLGM